MHRLSSIERYSQQLSLPSFGITLEKILGACTTDSLLLDYANDSCMVVDFYEKSTNERLTAVRFQEALLQQKGSQARHELEHIPVFLAVVLPF